MHVVVKSPLETLTKAVMIRVHRIDEIDVIAGELNILMRQEAYTELLGMLANRTVHGAGKAMPVARLNAASLEELSHIFQGFDRFLFGLRRESVHEIRVDQYPRIGESSCH